MIVFECDNCDEVLEIKEEDDSDAFWDFVQDQGWVSDECGVLCIDCDRNRKSSNE